MSLPHNSADYIIEVNVVSLSVCQARGQSQNSAMSLLLFLNWYFSLSNSGLCNVHSHEEADVHKCLTAH